MRSLTASACMTCGHTAACQSVMSAENLPLVGKLLGHRRHRTTGGHAHLADGHFVAATEQVNGIISVERRMRHTMTVFNSTSHVVEGINVRTTDT